MLFHSSQRLFVIASLTLASCTLILQPTEYTDTDTDADTDADADVDADADTDVDTDADNDADLDVEPDADEPTTAVVGCPDTPCGPGQRCCTWPLSNDWRCLSGSCTLGMEILCDDQADCPSGLVCCLEVDDVVQCQESCDAGGLVCADESECLPHGRSHCCSYTFSPLTTCSYTPCL